DLRNRRIIIPENLRKFQVDIYVSEIRKFNIDKLFLQKASTTSNFPGSDYITQSSLGNKVSSGIESNPTLDPNSEDNPANNFFNRDDKKLDVINENAAKIVISLE